ncbi:internalin N-terminal domain-containing protein, partial [Listeria monocytogenes]
MKKILTGLSTALLLTVLILTITGGDLKAKAAS